jgi:hypothetical protein
VVGEPAGVTLRIDGKVVGSTGQPYRVSPGAHELQLSHDGYLGHEQKVEVSANEHKKLRINLLREGDDTSTTTFSSSSKSWGWLSIGAGSLVLGTGVLMVAIDGNNSDSDRQARLYDTKALGLGGIATGTLLVGAGVTWLVLTSDDDGDEVMALSAGPTDQGMSVGLRGRF